MDPNQLSSPAPAGIAPQMGGVPATPELSQEQMKSNLQDLMSKIQGKYQDFNSSKFAAANKTVAQRSAAMRQLFQMFEAMGVDPSNAKQLKDYLTKLKQSNPEVYQQVEDALEALLGGSMGGGLQDTPQVAGTTPTAIANDAPISNVNQ